jgi:hypothetical protein
MSRLLQSVMRMWFCRKEEKRLDEGIPDQRCVFRVYWKVRNHKEEKIFPNPPTNKTVKPVRAESVAQVIEHLSSKFKAMSSNPSTSKKFKV